MFLKEIQPVVQQIVVAISSALKVEVEIADHQLFRIAGTGVFKSAIWKDMRNEDYVYRQCLETRKPVVIERPGFDPICRPCMHYNHCKELGELCCPILLEGKALGVIGLVAFTEEQKQRLFSDVKANLDFLFKMAELIATKIKQSELHEQHMIVERKLYTLIHYIDNGVVVINHEGVCEFLNPAAEKLLHLQPGQLPCKELIVQIVDSFGGDKPKSRPKPEEKLITVKNGDKYIQLFAAYHPSLLNDSNQDAIIVLMDPERMANAALRFTEHSQKGFESIIGNHPAIRNLKELMRKVANSRSPILIRGESGTGKEFIAQNIHQYSERKDHPFLTLNCAVLPEAVLERQLFGCETKPGKLAAANKGTLFLDEITFLPTSIQFKLLNILEEKMIWSNAEQDPIPLDVRIIAATDKNLEEMVRKGLFRQDLFYKLNVIPLHVHPLRERKEDILLLAGHFLQQHSQTNRKCITMFSEEVKKIFGSYHWPGNIRELSNVIEYAVNFANGKMIGKEHLPEHIRSMETADLAGGSSPDLQYDLKTIEKHTIQRVLAAVTEQGEPKEKAAEWLGISRATLFRKLQQYNLK
jgi:transcriptional regulator with PAS, ATPase and Fis domain